MTKTTSPADVLKDLEGLYALAMEKGNFTAALKAKELLGREQGLFSSSLKKKRLSLSDLSEEDLNRLIQEIEAHLNNE